MKPKSSVTIIPALRIKSRNRRVMKDVFALVKLLVAVLFVPMGVLWLIQTSECRRHNPKMPLVECLRPHEITGKKR